MKRHFKTILTGTLFLAIIGIGATVFVGPDHAGACGWGQSGGQDYVPERRGGGFSDQFAAKSSLTEEQARDIVSNHVKRLNPNLTVGQVNDAGSFFEAEILSVDNEVVQLLGVDKNSGRLMLIN